MPEGYCVKERKKVEIQNPEQITMKNGRPAVRAGDRIDNLSTPFCRS